MGVPESVRQALADRYVKPDNVLLAGTSAMLADLGVAKAISAAAADRPLTSVGVSVGTPANFGPYNQLQLVRIYLLLGEPEKALDQLEPLLRVPFHLSPGWLRIDPTFDPLRNNSRFRNLVEATI